MTVIRNQRGVVYGLNVNLIVEVCCTCSMPFSMPDDFRSRMLESRELFSCPAGHQQRYTGKSEAQKQRDRAEVLERRLRTARQSEDFYRSQALTARRSASAYKGHLTRMRNLVAQGICPVVGCRRNFHALGEHMRGQHPEWLDQHPEILVP